MSKVDDKLRLIENIKTSSEMKQLGDEIEIEKDTNFIATNLEEFGSILKDKKWEEHEHSVEALIPTESLSTDDERNVEDELQQLIENATSEYF